MSRKYDHLGDVETFVTVVERGSLTAAAVALSTTPSVISRALARLEARLGTQLLRRTTRSLGLTDAGRLYLEQTRAALSLIDDAERAVQAEGGEVTGRIRLSAPTTFGHYRLPALLQRFAERYPAVRVELNISNRNVDLAADNFDFAIRQGFLKDSSMIARKLEDAELVLVCAPAYVRRRGLPRDLEALAEHDCLTFLLPSTGRSFPWQFMRDGEELDWPPETALQVTDDALGVVSLAEAGLGICQTFRFIAQERLERGVLVELLPELKGRSRPFSLIYTPQRRMTAAARAFTNCLLDQP
ncbi:LysR family transcriptional regulator [Pseudoduganella sp. DS3]|uniref:LysR family transcriptional regulator n=1 Tax=Pseudoduganella guangdongensis TaxID=2692179 RepID=A0A6N9HBL3_9BURK|nr:LysR family transcriptional regulator [Pseudoduganella guangdongensis]MYN00884.1 LysR family transcriptional regulator [Pseudoduganella guangdongensis]